MKLAVHIIQEPGGGFTAWCPSLPGCRSRGESLSEARAKIEDAIRGYLAAVGNFIPEHLDDHIQQEVLVV